MEMISLFSPEVTLTNCSFTFLSVNEKIKTKKNQEESESKKMFDIFLLLYSHYHREYN